jgi:uncharacterized protein (DUF58 family)
MHRAALWRLARALGDEERLTASGSGVDLSALDEKLSNDTVDHVGWNTAARADRPHVRDLYDDQELDVWLLLDMNALIEWNVADYLKRDRAIEVAEVVGQLFGQYGDRVGALLFAERALRVVGAGAGYQHMLQTITSIQAAPRQTVPGNIDLASALVQAAAVIPRHSLLLIVSDFLAPEGWQMALGQLAQQHEVIALWIRNPREDELPNIGLVTIEDPQTSRQLVVDTSDAAVRARFQHAAQAQDVAISAAIVGNGVDLLMLNADDPLFPLLASFMHVRRQRQAIAARHDAKKQHHRSTLEDES